jgi:Glycosyl transferases group 1
MTELLDVVAHAVRMAGGRARTATGAFPRPGPDTVYVVVPHEFFVLTPDSGFPSAELCGRTIGFGVEHPGTATFERAAGLAGVLGAMVDINLDSAAELHRRGLAVEHFQLGYSPLWDAWGGDLDSRRDVDVTYLGTAERRRSALLGSYAADLEHLRTRLFTPPHEMMSGARVDFLPGAAKLAHLARSRILLNLHRERKQTLEWVRTLEALCNGCVVVSEPSTDVAPLVSGKHLVLARPESLGAVAAALCANPERERRLRAAGYELVKSLDMVASARLLIELASRLIDGATSAPPEAIGSARALAASVRSPDNAMAIDTPSWDVRFAGDRSLTGPDGSATRVLQRILLARRQIVPRWEPGPDPEAADVDVLLVRRPGEADPEPLINDLLTGTVRPGRVLLGEDGVLPNAACPWDRLVHERPLGRGLTRNALLARSTAKWLLVLDGGMRASRYLLERLLAARAEVDVVHCPVADPVEGVIGALPPEERRLATIPYLGSGYLVRRGLVERFGGWTEDMLVDGLEDHVFWRRVAAGEHPSALVQQLLLRRTRPDPDPRPVDLAPCRVWARVDALLAGQEAGLFPAVSR